MNPKLDCENLEVGQQVCVIAASERQIPSMKCTKRHTIQSSDNCYSMQQTFGITLDEMKFLNPWLDCSALKVGTEICSFSESSEQCAVFHQISNDEMLRTCEQLFAGFDISYDKVMNLNPTFQCDKLKQTSQICIGQGYFSSANCIGNIRISPDASNCQQIASTSATSVEQLQSINPTLNCTTSLIQGYHICVKSFVNQTVDLARNTVIEALSNFSSNIKTNFKNFRISPTQENKQIIYQSVVDTISNVDEKNFQQLYNSNADFRRIIDADTKKSGTRQELCEQIRTSKFSATVKSCICNSTTVLYYCQVKMIKEAETLIQNYRRLRKKREDDESSNKGPKIGCAPAYPKNTKNGSIVTGCFGGGCSCAKVTKVKLTV
uniref:LysM domain-containing protein n=1 Tax=Panagrolaimus superbus TaxID=310955 RepID=A0A914Z796_9BILA